MLREYCKAMELYTYIHLPKAKENVSEIKKCKRIPRIVYKLYRCIWKKGDVLLAMKISVYINFIRTRRRQY